MTQVKELVLLQQNNQSLWESEPASQTSRCAFKPQTSNSPGQVFGMPATALQAVTRSSSVQAECNDVGQQTEGLITGECV